MRAAAAIAANGSGAQAAEGPARQAVSVADASGGGIFSELLAQLLQIAPTAPAQDATSEQSLLTSDENGPSPGQIVGAQPPASSNIPASPAVTPAPNPRNKPSSAAARSPQLPPWLAALMAAMPQQPQQSSAPPEPASAQNQTPAIGATGGSANALPQSALPPATNTGSATPAFPAFTTGTTDSTASPASNSVAENATSSTLAAALLQKLTAGQQATAANQTTNVAQAAAASGPQTNTAPASPVSPAAQTSAAQTTAAAATSILSTLSAVAATPGSTGALAMSRASQVSTAERQVFAQATHSALHQGVTTPVTEAKALSLNLDSGAGNSASSSQQPLSGANRQSADAQATPPQSGPTGDPGPNAGVPPAVPAVHNANVIQQGANSSDPTSSATANAGTSAVASATQTLSTAFALQVGRTSPGTASSPQPNVQAIAISIASQAQTGSKQFNIRLDPPELGRVDVRLMVDSTGKAQAHLAVDKPQTLELLQRDSGTLARALKDSGVQLNNNGLQFSLKGQDRQGADAQPRGRALAVTAIPAATSSSGSVSSSTNFASGNGVDIRV